MTEENWHDATGYGDIYEQQVSDSGRLRHRQCRFDRPGPRAWERVNNEAEWRDGPAPKVVK
jgi:hypothetical protein